MWWLNILGYFAFLAILTRVILVTRDRQERWPHAKATVLAQKTRAGDMVIGFEVAGAGQVTARLPPPDSDALPPPGTIIEIAYDPADPARVMELAPAWVDAVLLMFFALMATAGLFMLMAG